MHYGIKGQKWGERLYQNPDGTYTELGKERRRKDLYKEVKNNVKKGYTPLYYRYVGITHRGRKSNQELVEMAKKNKNFVDTDEFKKELEELGGKYLNKKIKDIEGYDTYKDYLTEILRQDILSEAVSEIRKEKVEKEYKREIKDLPNKIERLKKQDFLTEENFWKHVSGEKRLSEEEIFKKDKRLRNAADLGLKALIDNIDKEPIKISKKESYNKDKNGWRFWFVCEDQTIGLATIADLVNQGKSKNEIINTLKDSSFVYNNISKEELEKEKINGLFQLSEAYGYADLHPSTEKFIDKCIDIYKEENKQK
jgi:hypothetical protein